MEAFMLVDDDALGFEPLVSSIHINELYIGGNSIFHETLENLWQSGIEQLTLVVEKNKAKRFEKYQRRFNFGRRDGHVDVDILALSVNKIMPGTVLREIHAIIDGLDDFILLFWNTLLTAPLHDPLELHRNRRRDFPRYSMSVLYIEDSQERRYEPSTRQNRIPRRFSGVSDDCMVLFNGNYELMAHQTGADKLTLDTQCVQRFKNDATVSVRYDLCRTGIYICNKSVAEHYTNWFEHVAIDEYVIDCISREFKTEEIYVTILKNDVMFPTFPPALRIGSPKDYYSVYMEYIRRFQANQSLSQKPPSQYHPQFGPMVRAGATFLNNSAFVPPFKKTKYLFTSVFNSIVGQKVYLGKHSMINRCIIFDDVTIGRGCSLQDSIIMNGVKIANDTVIPPGSIVCSNVSVTPKLMEGLVGSLRASTQPPNYVDLTCEEEPEELQGKRGDRPYLWPVNAFGAIEDAYIGNSFYNMVTFKVPMDSSTEASSYRDDAKAAKHGDDGDSCSATSDSEDDDDGGNETTDYDYSDDEGGILRPMVDREIVEELNALVTECLELPNQMPNKVLEIKSLKISHNLQKSDMLKISFEHALRWAIEQAKDPEELQEVMENARLRELLETFEGQMVEKEHYPDVLRVCSEMKKDTDFFSHVCEALYHADIMEFEGLQDWLAKNAVSGPRIDSFAQWLAED